MRNGQVVSEQYWHGLSAQQAWPLLGGTRPCLSLLGAMAVTQGKLAADRSSSASRRSVRRPACANYRSSAWLKAIAALPGVLG